MHNFINAFNVVCELVNDFKENEQRYLSPKYQEAEVRRDFIDKLLEALGWDVYHRTQKNPYAQEVKVEKGVNIGKAQKRADYAFYISPEYRQPKFFVEAKKPSRNLKNADDYFQTIRYGWNANTPVAVLTDFQEFHILDCRYKPNIANVLSNPNHKSFVYTDFLDKEKFGEIYYLFARNHVAENSLEKYTEGFEKIKGKAKASLKGSLQAIDDDFLSYIDELRETLAKAFKKNDSKLSSEELTEATQRTIDRIVFIRFLEDKLIEPEYHISAIAEKGNAWTDFISLCRKLDAKYNGIVFKKHFIDEQAFLGPEQNVFKKICADISHLNSPYDFNVIPIHILGSIYERFLGKVVSATAQRVKVEEKPEVRKAGGVYYTPKYIVDYIVENTVGKIIRNENTPSLSSSPISSSLSSSNVSIGDPGDSNGFSLSSPHVLGGDPIKTNKENTNSQETHTDKEGNGVRSVHPDLSRQPACFGLTPKEISKLRFADIACGSGSFLIGVYDTLLKYHSEYYQAHPEEAQKDRCLSKDGQWILSIKQKQNILLNNIYGVDIDHQAVEVTQLSLALKMLEDESLATANEMQVLFHEKILPDLSKNIVCGNSLIGTDILDGKMFETEEERKLNPMDFESRFSEIMKNGGFDVIIGNPPYVKAELIGDLKNYFSQHYSTYTSMADLYTYFIEKGMEILKDGGKFSFIVSNKWMRSNYGNNLRKHLKKYFIKEIIDFGELPVFKDASTFPMILVIDKNKFDGKTFYAAIKRLNFIDLRSEKENIGYLLEAQAMNENGYTLANTENINILNKITLAGTPLNKYCKIPIRRGILTGYNPAFIIDEEKKHDLIEKDSTSSELINKFVFGDDVRKYIIDFRNRYVIFTRRGINIESYKAVKEHLFKWKHELTPKKLSSSKIGRKPGAYQWYEVQDVTAYYNEFLKPKIIYGQFQIAPHFAFDDTGLFFGSNHYMIPFETAIEAKYLLGILNSKLYFFYMKSKAGVLGDADKKGRLIAQKSHFIQFPVRVIDPMKSDDIKIKDKLLSLVEQILESKKLLHSAKTERDKTYYENKCANLDRAIDSEVYKLYGLTDDEIKIIEKQ